MTAIPPPPDYPPTAGVPEGTPVEWWRSPAADARPRPASWSAARLPDWRDPNRPDPLAGTTDPAAADDQVEDQLGDEQDEEVGEKPGPELEGTSPAGDDEPAAEEQAEDEADDDQGGGGPADTPPVVTPPAPAHAADRSAWRGARFAERRRAALYNGAAAAIGWIPAGPWPGIGRWVLQLMTYYGRDSVRDGITAGVIFIGLTLPLDLRGHRWRHHEYPLLRAAGWICRIPLAAAVVALAFYTPDATL